MRKNLKESANGVKCAQKRQHHRQITTNCEMNLVFMRFNPIWKSFQTVCKGIEYNPTSEIHPGGCCLPKWTILNYSGGSGELLSAQDEYKLINSI